MCGAGTARRHWHYHVDIIGGTHADYRRIGDEQLGHLTADEHELSKQWPSQQCSPHQAVSIGAAHQAGQTAATADAADMIRSCSSCLARVRSRARPRRTASTSASSS